MTKMKAVRMHEYGGPDVLQVEVVPRPSARAGEILVRVHASGVNPIDWKVREGYLRHAVPLRLPAVLGADFSGVVEAAGQGVKSYRRGDAVFGRAEITHDGTYAEYITVPADHVVRKPDRIDHVHAAGVPTAALTAWQALIDAPAPAQSANVSPGEKVLIHGAAGGVGSFAIQFAKHRGAWVVATASVRHREFLRGLGADAFVDYTTQRFEDVARDVDVVLDTIGGDTQTRSWSTLRRGGVLVSTVGVNEEEARRHGARAIVVSGRMNARILQRIAGLIERGVVRVHVSKVLPLTQTRRAHEESQSGHVEGKLVLSVAK